MQNSAPLAEKNYNPLFNKGKKNLVIEAIVDGKTEIFNLPEAKDAAFAYERLLQLII
jgi:hypothetical protein